MQNIKLNSLLLLFSIYAYLTMRTLLLVLLYCVYGSAENDPQRNESNIILWDAQKISTKKILQPPLAFSYNSLPSTDNKKNVFKEFQQESSVNYSNTNEKDNMNYKSDYAYVNIESDTEDHQGSYDDTGKKETERLHNESYHAENDISDEQDSQAEFEDEGEHVQGHSTKGDHSISNKNYYKNTVRFYDEFFDDDVDEKTFGLSDEKDFLEESLEKEIRDEFAADSSEYDEDVDYENRNKYDNKKGLKENLRRSSYIKHNEKLDDAYSKKSNPVGKEKHENEKGTQSNEINDNLMSQSMKLFKHYNTPESYSNANSKNLNMTEIREQYKKSSNAIEALETLLRTLDHDQFKDVIHPKYKCM